MRGFLFTLAGAHLPSSSEATPSMTARLLLWLLNHGKRWIAAVSACGTSNAALPPTADRKPPVVSLQRTVMLLRAPRSNPTVVA